MYAAVLNTGGASHGFAARRNEHIGIDFYDLRDFFEIDGYPINRSVFRIPVKLRKIRKMEKLELSDASTSRPCVGEELSRSRRCVVEESSRSRRRVV